MSKTYDVIILGAGINGVAIAKALSLEEQSVCIIDKSAIASGASSNSSRLIHGGLRYLEHFEFSLVKEALKDQKYLLQTYPDLVKLSPFYLPSYKPSSRPKWMIKIGMWLYSFFGSHTKDSEEVSKASFLKMFPCFKAERLNFVFKYYDAQTDDDALTTRIAAEAEQAGTHFKLLTHLLDIDLSNELIELKLEDETIKTPLLINATGAWIDEVNAKHSLPSRFSIEKLSGIHIEFEGRLTSAPLILETRSKRIIFILPQTDTTLIGTTERTEVKNIDDVRIDEEDITYLLEEINVYLNIPLLREDIIDTFIGVRPIIKTKKDPSKMSREYKLDLHQLDSKRVLHIYGGKLTTFHSLADKVVKKLKG